MIALLALAAHLALASAEASAPSAAAVSSRTTSRVTFWSGAVERSYELYVPDSAGARAPVLIVLHGSGGSGRQIIAYWRELADHEGLVLVAPNAFDNRWWRLREDSPAFFLDLVQSVASREAIDLRRLYLFGQSGGAVYVLTLGLLESELFAAAAVHAGAWRTEKEFGVLQHARRKIPVALFVGDRDEYFSTQSVLETRGALQRAGHPTLLKVIPRHHHAYSEVSADVNREAWEFLRTHSLNEAPKYQSYDTATGKRERQ